MPGMSRESSSCPCSASMRVQPGRHPLELPGAEGPSSSSWAPDLWGNQGARWWFPAAWHVVLIIQHRWLTHTRARPGGSPVVAPSRCRNRTGASSFKEPQSLVPILPRGHGCLYSTSLTLSSEPCAVHVCPPRVATWRTQCTCQARLPPHPGPRLAACRPPSGQLSSHCAWHRAAPPTRST